MSPGSLYRKARKLAAIVMHPEYRKGLLFAVAPAIEHEAMLRSLPPLATIVDVGAHKGQFTLVARRFHSEANITAFEPLPGAGQRFARTFGGDPRVVLHRIALGSRSEDGQLNVSTRDDTSSLLPITDLQETTFPGTGLKVVEQVTIKRLEDVLNEQDISGPALLKVDVQGGELGVLVGAGDLLRAFDFVCVEGSFVEFYAGQPLAHQVLGFMEKSSFTLRGVYSPLLDGRGRSVQADFLFGRTNGPVAPGPR